MSFQVRKQETNNAQTFNTRLGISAAPRSRQYWGSSEVPLHAPCVITRLKLDRKLAVFVIWKAAQPVANMWVSREAKLWGMDSFRSATIEMPRTQI